MPHQTTFGNPAVGYAGMLADSSDALIDHLSQDETSAAIHFGKAIKANGETGCKLPASASDEIQGIAMAAALVPDDGTDRAYQPGSMVQVLRRGRIWVEVEQTVAKDDPVFVRAAAGGSGVGSFRKDGIGAVAAVKRKQTLTISGPLDKGQPRIQTLTFNQDIQAAETVDLNINGQAITQVMYATSHHNTMETLVKSIRAKLAAQGKNAHVDLTGGGTNYVITITSLDQPFALAAEEVTGIVIGTAAGLTLTPGETQVAKVPHSLSIDLDGGAALVQEWRGTSDATLHAFAALLEGQAAIESAVVTPATDTGGGHDDAERVITVTAAAGSPTANAFTTPLASNGQTARTLTPAETVAGVAAVAATAIAVPGAAYLKGASSGGRALLDFRWP